jgi:hypothetical protein
MLYKTILEPIFASRYTNEIPYLVIYIILNDKIVDYLLLMISYRFCELSRWLWYLSRWKLDVNFIFYLDKITIWSFYLDNISR